MSTKCTGSLAEQFADDLAWAHQTFSCNDDCPMEIASLAAHHADLVAHGLVLMEPPC